MIISLLYVGLLCMGVGAKASTPINLNDNRISQKQQRQKNNEAQQNIFTSSITDTQENWYNIGDIQQDGTGVRTEYLQQNYTLNNDNAIIGLKKYQKDLYQIPVDKQTGQALYPGTWALFPTQAEGIDEQYKYPQEVYILRVDGSTKGFKNVQYSIDIMSSIPEFVPIDAQTGQETTNYEWVWTSKYTMYQTTENIEQFYNEDTEYLENHNPKRLYDRFTNGNLKASRITYNTKPNGSPQNVTIIANKINYICLFGEHHIKVQENQEQFRRQLQNWEILIKGTNGDSNRVENTYTQIRFTPRPTPEYHYSFTGEYIELANINQEVIDLPGLIWEILSMPFAFISTAFNLTLFPGTQYAINIANLVLTIFGVLVFSFIVKLLIKK